MTDDDQYDETQELPDDALSLLDWFFTLNYSNYAKFVETDEDALDVNLALVKGFGFTFN